MHHAPAVPQHYRLTDPVSRLAVRLQEVSAEPGEPPRIVPRLVPAECATRFVTAQAANNAWALYLGPQHLELERVDA